jgi:hypothetical protein
MAVRKTEKLFHRRYRKSPQSHRRLHRVDVRVSVFDVGEIKRKKLPIFVRKFYPFFYFGAKISLVFSDEGAGF